MLTPMSARRTREAAAGLDLAEVRVLIFDVDGTLSDTDNVVTARLASLIPQGLVADRRRFARSLVMSLEGPANTAMAFADRIGLDDEMVAALDWAYRHRGHSRAHTRMIEGVDALLEDLHVRYPMAIVSARDERSTLRFLDAHGLRRHFGIIVTAQSAEHTKPYPDPILLAASHFGVPAGACLMVGDTTIDITAARRAGAQSIGVLCGFGRRSELLRAGAGAVLATTADLQSYLRHDPNGRLEGPSS